MIWLFIFLVLWVSVGVSFYAGCVGVVRVTEKTIPGSGKMIGEVGSIWKYVLTGPILPVYILIFHAGE